MAIIGIDLGTSNSAAAVPRVGRPGDQNLNLRLHVPERLSKEEREAYQRLKDLQGK